ncbi:EpsG family protein [Allofournierella sp.]|uniref:EpsG family protein n=1 Tax=Allofournierella sp. TaxID=1940256 RepID=UPI003AB4B7EB
MIEPLYWGTLAFSGICAFSRKIQKDKIANQIAVIITVLCIVLIVSANRQGNDIINYVRSYNSTKTFNREPLYHLLEVMGKAVELNFYQFRAAVSIIGYVLIISTLKKYTRNVEFVLFFYCFHLIFMDSGQLRNFLAVSIWVFSIRFVCELKTSKNLIYYCICIILACGIHTASIFYFILVLLLIRGRKTFTKALFGLGAGMALLTYLNGNRIPYISIIISFLLGEEQRAQNYFSSVTTRGFLGPVGLYILGIWGLLFIKRQMHTTAFNEETIKFGNIVLMINCCFVVAVPLTMMNLTFYRLLRNLLYFNLAVYSNGYFCQNKIKQRWMIMLFTIFLCLGWALFDFTIYSSPEYTIAPVFNGEWFWK